MPGNPTKRAVMLSEKSHMQRSDSMLHFRPGSQAMQLITLLSFVGEFPIRSVHLLGNERVLKALIHRLTSQQLVRNSQTGNELTSRMLTIAGKSYYKSIRMYKGALPILDWLHPDAYGYYMDTFWNHRFPGDQAHRERNQRVAEAAALCMRAGMEARPYMLPKFQNQELLQVVPGSPSFYLAKDLKKVGETEINKIMFTRMVGAVFSFGCCYAVYNTRDAVMKWSGMGEFKALHSLTEIARQNAGVSKVSEAILIGQSGETALQTLQETDKTRRLEFRFDSIYRHIYFVPMNEYGIRQLSLLSVPDWKERQLELLFEPEVRSYDKGFFEYDACVDGVYIFSHLDSDIARLLRFRDAIENQVGRFEVLCFPYQAYFLREYLGSLVSIKTIDMEAMEAELELDRRNLLEG